MHTEGNEVHVSEEEASAGSKEGVVRWVLIGGLLLVVLGFAAVLLFGIGSRPNDPMADNANVSAKVAAQEEARAGAESSDTDSIVTTPTSPAGTANERETENGLPVVNN